MIIQDFTYKIYIKNKKIYFLNIIKNLINLIHLKLPDPAPATQARKRRRNEKLFILWSKINISNPTRVRKLFNRKLTGGNLTHHKIYASRNLLVAFSAVQFNACILSIRKYSLW
jgi:hypothetical protein